MTKTEKKILKILMESKEPLSTTTILNIEPDLNRSTIRHTLSSLLSKGLIYVDGSTLNVTVYERTYRVTSKAIDAIIEEIAQEYSNFSNFISKSDFCIALFQLNKQTAIAESEIANLKQILDDFENRNV